MTGDVAYEPLLDADPRLADLQMRVDPSIVTVGDVQMMAVAEGMTPGGPGGPSGPQPIQLNHHLVASSAYTRDMSGKLNWFSGLFKAKGEVQAVGVVQEAKSFTVRKIDGQDVEIGVAIRLQIEATTFKTEAQVSVANIAAEAQLGLSNAKMDISVRGYSGWLGDLLPAPSEVDLGSYGHYLEAFAAIQKHVFGQSASQFISPVPLGIRHER